MSTITIILVLTMQYSGAQSIVPILKEGILTLDEEPQVKGEEPAQEEPQK